jgi:hypothetical protein
MTATALKPPWTLLGIAAVLAGVLALEWIVVADGAPPPAAASAEGTPAAAPAGAARRFDPPSAARYAEIAARPLFIPNRRPQAEDADAQAARSPVQPPSLSVQGVVLTPNRRIAVIAHGAPVKFVAVAEGDTIDGWRVDSIDREHVALSSGDAKIEVPVAKFGNHH